VVFALTIIALVVVAWIVVALAALSLCRISALADADARRLVARQLRTSRDREPAAPGETRGRDAA
jgi:hypothetical protein